MNVELYNEVSLMTKYKADKDHWHSLTWIIVIFLFMSVFSLESDNRALEARIAHLEQTQ